ncbi:RWD domain-containing protein 3 isoform X1 [Carcharodon carcharias]|uniref:RWD domain-containing protein 3 isoform X1 n=1 Tax=Carcharodon carcharias TaxID=13397 RepID=UPI001B7E9FC6|nr:RWD domain-containing protein 3 isoform X1 [Carcharodon carcharias]
MAAREEVAALGAIYNGDFHLLAESESEEITFQIHTICEHHAKKIQLNVTFQLSPDYPSCLPDISICSDQLTRKQCCDLKQSLLQYAETLLTQPMVYELMMQLQQKIEGAVEQVTGDKVNESDNSQQQCNADEAVWVALVHLDHMRAKAKYIKSIEKWTSDLRLGGRLMFMGKLILILLQGERKAIKDYLVLQKTSKVDVDSSGKRCKEKMISVLCEEKLQAGQLRLTRFAVKEFTSGAELHQEFEALGLSGLYDKFVRF